MTFNFHHISEKLVAKHDCSEVPLFSLKKTLEFYSCPDQGSLRMSGYVPYAYSTPNEYKMIVSDPDAIKIMLGPRGSTLQQMYRQLRVAIIIREGQGGKLVTISGTHYGCYAATLVLRDMVANVHEYKKIQLYYLEREKMEYENMHPDNTTVNSEQKQESAGSRVGYMRTTADTPDSAPRYPFVYRNTQEPPTEAKPIRSKSRRQISSIPLYDSASSDAEQLFPPGSYYL